MMELSINSLTPVFILGLPRSGTTLLQSLLDGHPQILNNVGDARFFGGYWPRARWRSSRVKDQLADKYILHMFMPEGIYYQRLLSHIPLNTFLQNFWQEVAQSPRTPKAYLEAYMVALGRASGLFTGDTICWIDKDPGQELYIDKILSWWPSAQFIHVIRDPRSVYSSYKRRDERSGRPITSIESFSFGWCKSAQCAAGYQPKLGQARYHIVRYESLVSNLSLVLNQLGAFLNITDHEILHQPTKGLGRVPWGSNAVSGKKTYQVHKDLLEKWRTELSPEEIKAIESRLWHYMHQFDYEPLFAERQANTTLKGMIGDSVRAAKLRLRTF